MAASNHNHIILLIMVGARLLRASLHVNDAEG
jgi:hypothetical protein